MTSYDASRVTPKLGALFIRGEERMATFGISKDKLALEHTDLLQGNTQGPRVHDLKTDPVIIARCDSSDLNATVGTPLGLSNILKVTNRGMDKTLQRSN